MPKAVTCNTIKSKIECSYRQCDVDNLRASKDQTIERLTNSIEYSTDEEDKLNMITYKAALELGKLDGLEGRYAVFHRGYIFSATFDTENSFLEYDDLEKTNESYTLYRIPGISTEHRITSYHELKFKSEMIYRRS
jgi:hypothetical protein